MKCINQYLFIFSCDVILKNTGKVKSHWKKRFPMIYLSSLEGEFWSHGKINFSKINPWERNISI
jgi:hypothetical protein